MMNDLPKYYHLHLVSDSTGETLSTIARAVTVQYTQMRALEHIHPKVLSSADLMPVTKEIASAPGIVLYTIIDKAVAHELEQSCQNLGLPCIAVLNPTDSVSPWNVRTAAGLKDANRTATVCQVKCRFLHVTRVWR